MVCVEPCGFSLAACCHCSCWVPGVSRMNLVKLRSSTGRSVICLESNRVATSARSVVNSVDPPVTVTCSVISPTCSWNSTGVCASTPTTTFGTRALLNPESSACTLYSPGSSRSLTNSPDSLLTTVSVVLRARLTMVMVAPGRTAPDESRTVPPMLPYTAWAVERAGSSRRRNAARPQRTITRVRDIGPPSRRNRRHRAKEPILDPGERGRQDESRAPSPALWLCFFDRDDLSGADIRHHLLTSRWPANFDAIDRG